MSSGTQDWAARRTATRRVLVVDDDPGLVRLIARGLRAAGFDTVGTTTGREALDWLAANNADLVLIDFRLPDMHASDLVDSAAARGDVFPFIVITGFGDERVAVEMMKRGARDYLRKDSTLLELLPSVVERTVEQIERERRVGAAEDAYRLLHSAVNQAKDAVVITTASLDDPGPEIVFANPAFFALTGYAEEELLGRSPRLLQGAETDREELARLRASLAAGQPWSGQLVNYRKDRTQYLAELHLAPVRGQDGKVTHFVAIERDITEKSRIEQQLRQSAKMEAIGALAGGISHDFNNMLSVIRGHTDLALAVAGAGSSIVESLEAVRDACDHAATLTRQLLSFSRSSILQPETVNLNQIVERTVRLLRRLLGERITMSTSYAPDLVRVSADPGQMEQVVLNLAINARDAMPGGGRISFRLQNLDLAQDGSGRLYGIPAGRYALLTVSDTGEGMDPETMSHIFEPFFTTKESGKGTGLGLATVYGIVHQSDGHIRVHSERGQGTRFEIYLPAQPAAQAAAVAATPAAAPERAQGTVLVAEDEDMVRDLIVRCLRGVGYTVYETRNGREALELVRMYNGPLDVLVTDLMMPHVAGPELATEMRARFPDLKVLFVSGYADRAMTKASLLESGGAFLPKPFMTRDLLEKLRELLRGDL